MANRRRNQNRSRDEKQNNNRGNRRDRRSSEDKRYDEQDAKLDAKGRDNNPNWYFTDKMLADQVSQLSFQQIAGVPTLNKPGTRTIPVANICRILLNPCPGVQDYEYVRRGQKSAINQAGFKMFSLLSAYTGRAATYGPQDISTMILYMGEVISVVEYLRRVFGCMFLWSERDRTFPKQIIRAMGIDPDDLMRNYSDYRTKFNAIVQRINQIPIPRDIAYFDKCASLYEKIYKDSESGMAELIFFAPATVWRLDETSDQRGTILKTTTWLKDQTGADTEYTTMAAFLIDLDSMVNDLLNSSSLQVVYTDILNLATKMKVEFWKFDYLSEGYVVVPEYNPNFLLQFHNMNTVGYPLVSVEIKEETAHVTPWNDVVPDPDNNGLYYNPGFRSTTDKGIPNATLCDLPMDNPSVEDRIESLRFTSLSTDGCYVFLNEQQEVTDYFQTNMALPDHYVTYIEAFNPAGEKVIIDTFRDITNASVDGLKALIQANSCMSHLDWSPIIYGVYMYENPTPTGFRAYTADGVCAEGDLNFWTMVEAQWIKKVVDFVGIALYSIR